MGTMCMIQKAWIDWKSAVDIPSHPDSARRLTDSDIEDIAKENW